MFGVPRTGWLLSAIYGDDVHGARSQDFTELVVLTLNCTSGLGAAACIVHLDDGSQMARTKVALRSDIALRFVVRFEILIGIDL